MPRKVKAMYANFPSYPEEKVDEALAILNEEEQEIIRKRYGDDLTCPKQERTLNKQEQVILYNRIFIKIRKYLSRESCNTSKKTKTIYELVGKKYKKDDIDKIIAELPEEQKKIIELKYGSDLENPNQEKAITKQEISTLYRVIIPKIRTRVDQNKTNIDKKVTINNTTNRKIKTIYELVGNEYKKEDIDKIIEELPIERKKFIELRYGNDLENPCAKRPMTKKEMSTFYSLIIPKIKLKLKEMKENEGRKAKALETPLVKSTTEDNSITKEGLNDIKDLLIKPSFKRLLEVLTPKEAIVFCLRFGLTNKTYSIKEIAEFLEVSEEDIVNITNIALKQFQENINVLLKKEEEKVQSLKLALKEKKKI